MSTDFWAEFWEKPSGVVDMESGLHKDSLDGSVDVRYVFHLESFFLGMVRVAVSHQTFPIISYAGRNQHASQFKFWDVLLVLVWLILLFLAWTFFATPFRITLSKEVGTKEIAAFCSSIYPAYSFCKIRLQCSVLSQGSPLALPATRFCEASWPFLGQVRQELLRRGLFETVPWPFEMMLSVAFFPEVSRLAPWGRWSNWMKLMNEHKVLRSLFFPFDDWGGIHQTQSIYIYYI